MKNVRLTKSIRDTIIHKAIFHGLSEKEEKLKKFEDSLASRILDGYLGEHKIVMKQLPDEYFILSEKIYIKNVDGHGYHTLRFISSRRLPYSASNYNGIRTHLLSEVEDLYKKKGEFQDEKRSIKQQLIDLLSSVTTVKGLLEIWPEGKEFIPTSKNPLEVPIPVSDINQKLGL